MVVTIAFSNRSVVSCTLPSGSITALMPETDACRTGRAVSAARISLFARCCAELPERWYERLLVLTTTISAPSRTESRTSGPKPDSKQITLPIRWPPARNTTVRSPARKSYGIWRNSSMKPRAPRHGTYSPNGTRCCFE